MFIPMKCRRLVLGLLVSYASICAHESLVSCSINLRYLNSIYFCVTITEVFVVKFPSNVLSDLQII